MLSRQEQDEIIKRVRKIMSLDRARQTRVRRHLMSDREAKLLTERSLAMLADHLKDVG